jgi:hypothetical protein
VGKRLYPYRTTIDILGVWSNTRVPSRARFAGLRAVCPSQQQRNAWIERTCPDWKQYSFRPQANHHLRRRHTPREVFFLGFIGSWCRSFKEVRTRLLHNTSGTSSPKYRRVLCLPTAIHKHILTLQIASQWALLWPKTMLLVSAARAGTCPFRLVTSPLRK